MCKLLCAGALCNSSAQVAVVFVVAAAAAAVVVVVVVVVVAALCVHLGSAQVALRKSARRCPRQLCAQAEIVRGNALRALLLHLKLAIIHPRGAAGMRFTCYVCSQKLRLSCGRSRDRTRDSSRAHQATTSKDQLAKTKRALDHREGDSTGTILAES